MCNEWAVYRLVYYYNVLTCSTMGRMDGVVFPNPEASFVKEL